MEIVALLIYCPDEFRKIIEISNTFDESMFDFSWYACQKSINARNKHKKLSHKAVDKSCARE